MVQSTASTVDAYLEALDPDRRAAIRTIRQLVLDHLPDGYAETMQYGMPSYIVPAERYPDTYNGQPLAVISFASQKQYMSLYLMALYDTDLETELRAGFEAMGKKPNLGRCCVRFKKIEDLPLDAIRALVAKVGVDDFIAQHERAQANTAKGRKKAARKKSGASS